MRAGVKLWRRHGLNIFRFYASFFKSVRQAFMGSRKKGGKRKKGQSGGINLREARRWSDDVFAEEIRRLMQSSGKPIVPVPFEPSSVPAIFKNLGLVAFRVPEEAVLAIAKLAHYHDFLDRHQKEQELVDYEAPDDDMALAIKSGLEGRSGALSESESKTILTRYGIDVTVDKQATTAEEAAAAASEIGFPVVLKVDSPDITHKSDAGGVKVGLESADEVKDAFAKIMESCRAYDSSARINGVVVQEMVEGGTEVLVGISRESHYGHTIVFGLGGIFVEVLDDVALRILPIDLADAEKMIDEIRGRKVLSGIRGEGPRDVKALAEAIKRTADLAWDLRHRLDEMDVNPLVVLPEGQGVKALDALIILNDEK
jgi:acetyltransferase